MTESFTLSLFGNPHFFATVYCYRCIMMFYNVKKMGVVAYITVIFHLKTMILDRLEHPKKRPINLTLANTFSNMLVL